MIKLRELETRDADGMLEWMHDPEIQKQFRIPMGEKTLEDALMFIETADVRLLDGKNIHYAIADEEDEYLGTISLKGINLVDKNAEYAISLRKRAQGKGIAFWATREILQKAFCQHGLERIYLNVLSDNIKAIYLYERCGFVYEGEFRRHIFLKGEYKTLKWYSILKEEYFEMVPQMRGGNRFKQISRKQLTFASAACSMPEKEAV